MEAAKKSYRFYRLGNEMNVANSKTISEELSDLDKYMKLRQDQQDNTNIWNVLRMFILSFQRITFK